MVEEGYVNLTYNMGGGPISVKETRRKVDDGYYHRIRVFRNGYWMLLEVDDLKTRHVSTKPSGEQFNEQQSIWLGSHPGQNGSSALRGILTGVFYNGLLLSELAAGLSHRADIHVSRHPEIQYLANFKVKLARDSPLQILPPELLESDNATLAHHDESARPAVSPKAQSAWEVTDPSFSVSSAKWGGRQHDSPEHAPASTKDTSRFPQPAAATSEPPQRPFSGHVNVWLVVSLAGAGLIFICSVTFLVYWWFGSQHRSYMTVPQSFSLVMPTSATTTTPSEIAEQSYVPTRSNLPTSPAAAGAASLSSPPAQPLHRISPGLPGTTGSATAVTLFSAPPGLAYVSFSDSSPLVPVSFCPAISLTTPNEDPTHNSVQDPLQIAMTSSALTVRPTSLFLQQQLPAQQQRETDQSCWQDAAAERRVVDATDGTLVRIVHRQQTHMQPQKSDFDPV
nr:unnamed protein product [Spirometra erinaceieuropaei]